jgi:hypothetical protein
MTMTQYRVKKATTLPPKENLYALLRWFEYGTSWVTHSEQNTPRLSIHTIEPLGVIRATAITEQHPRVVSIRGSFKMGKFEIHETYLV